MYIDSPSLHQEVYQIFIKCFSNYIPIHIISNILSQKDVKRVNDEVCKDKSF